MAFEAKEVKLAGSILDADFSNLLEQIRIAVDAGLDMLHFDIADGCFVPKITFGVNVVESVRRRFAIPSEVHLMVVNPERYVEPFANLGVEYVYFHYEATRYHYRVIRLIQEKGAKAGIALNPSTELLLVKNLLEHVDAVLVMLVEPGFGGQQMIEGALSKVAALRKYREKRGLEYKIAVDGGIKHTNVDKVLKAGADIVVVGSGIFKEGDIASAVRKLKEIMSESSGQRVPSNRQG